MDISLNKDNELKFKLNIEGAKQKPNVRFLLNISDNLSIMTNGILEEGGIAKVIIPKMPFINKASSSLNGKVEVIVDGQHFVPWEGSLHVKEDLKVEATEVNVENKIDENKIKVSAVHNEDEEKTAFYLF